MTDVREGKPSASKFERIVHCPGSQWMENNAPPLPEQDEVDPDANRGERIHRAFETGNTLELNEEETEAYKAGVKFTEMLVEKWRQDFNLRDVYELPREQRTWYNHPETLEPLGSAKCDRRYVGRVEADPYTATQMLIIDLKSGFAKHVPPAPRSWQLRLQALCEWRENDDVNHIRVAFARAMSKIGADDYCDYTESDLQHVETSVLQAVWEASQPDARRTPGEWCRYCPGRNGFCDQAAAYSMLPSVIARRAGGAITKKDDALALVNTLTPADLLRVWEVSGQVKWIIEGVDKRLKAMPQDELSALGLEIAPGRWLDPITDVRGCVDYLFGRGWDPLKVWECLSISKTDLAKLARQEKGLTSDKAASEWIADKLAEFITKKNSEGWLRKIK